ncbi:hypothetical protein [Cytophaga aurantiaca]|uniref:hypothetical protein n=1 Tax=Cytophaga aurantiaca TaxID=29530 RepID=UPI000378C5DF|nr:hypothetical protein [Cytophaga aurantiaca]
MYKQLNIDKIIEIIHTLSLRIEDRFPQADLLNVSNELNELAIKSKASNAKLAKPYILIRIALVLLIVIASASIVYTLFMLRFDDSLLTVQNFITVSEAFLNETITIGFAFYFLYKFEDFIKQKKILTALQELRTIAHIIDLHQLTKDPTHILAEKTKHSPKREFTKAEVSRYLIYCSEMLSLTSKVAATYAFNNKDEMILNTIHDIEVLCSTLSSKIWQKIELNKVLK